MCMTQKELEALCQRLKKNYPDHKIVESEKSVTISTPLSDITVCCDGAYFYVSDRLLYHIEPCPKDELYEQIEYFIYNTGIGERQCNSTFDAVSKELHRKAASLSTVIWALQLILLYIFIFSGNLLFMGAILVLLICRLYAVHLFKSNVTEKKWVCPHCSCRLPVMKIGMKTEPKYTAWCPCCNASLLDTSLSDEFKNQLFSDVMEKEPSKIKEVKTTGRKALCIFSGVMLLAAAILFFLVIFSRISFNGTLNSIFDIIIFITMLVSSGLLIFCNAPKEQHSEKDKALHQPACVTAVGILLVIFGLLFSFSELVIFREEALILVLFFADSVLMTLLGTFMMLYGKNKSVYICDDNVEYFGILGKKKTIHADKISSVRFTSSRFIMFYDEKGNKLFSLADNMKGVKETLEWFSQRNGCIRLASVINKRLCKTAYCISPVFWKDEYRTSMHSHIPAIKTGLKALTALFILSALSGYLLIFSKGDITVSLRLVSFSPLPLIIYYLCFAPVICFGNYPAGATDEWRKMHIRFPVLPFYIVTMLNTIFAVSVQNVLRIADTERFIMLCAVPAVILLVLSFVRIPKRMYMGGNILLAVICFMFFCFSFTYSAIFTFSKDERYYPAVITDVNLLDPGESRDKFQFNVILDDGKEIKMEGGRKLYENMDDLIICQKENNFGIRIVYLYNKSRS